MAVAVEVPKLGNTVEECLIAKWRKHPGDSVSAGEVVAEIETDKATFEVTAPQDGTVLATFFPEGALVPVFTNLFVIGNPGESADAFQPDGTASSVPTPPPPQPQPAAAEAVSILPTVQPQTAHLSPRARRFAHEHHLTGPLPPGSGPGGRILEQDLRRQYYTRELHPDGAGLAIPAVAPSPAAVSTIRQKIARRMRESLAATAQYTLHGSANASGLLLLRAKVKASPHAPDININELVTFCAVKALLEVPALNAEFSDGRITQHAGIHIGFACDTPRGLMVPVIRDAHQLSPAELSARMKALTAQAVQGAISPDDLSGGTFTVSNLGNLGVEWFTPLLNPPQVGILGVGSIQLKPVRRDGRIEFIDAIALSLTLDHQVVDGAPGARFLDVVRRKIENVESLCTI